MTSLLAYALGCVTPWALHHAHLRLAMWVWRRAYDSRGPALETSPLASVDGRQARAGG